jgi:hypothetical protein
MGSNRVRRDTMLKTCWFDKDGNLINIGEWDPMPEQVEIETREVLVDVPDDYNLQPYERWYREIPGMKKIVRIETAFETVERNPIPEGAYSEEREVIQTEDGGLALAEDYAALRRTAYPPYTVWDVLDEVLKIITPPPGSKLEEIQAARLAVKAQYPKPEGDAQ